MTTRSVGWSAVIVLILAMVLTFAGPTLGLIGIGELSIWLIVWVVAISLVITWLIMRRKK